MDLSFELGVPVSELAHRLTEEDFMLYQVYAARRMLPTRRMEKHFALLTQMVCFGNGASDALMSDFLFDPENSDDAVVSAEEAQQFFGFAPRKKKR